MVYIVKYETINVCLILSAPALISDKVGSMTIVIRSVCEKLERYKSNKLTTNEKQNAPFVSTNTFPGSECLLIQTLFQVPNVF
jgi:hypothetical protein